MADPSWPRVALFGYSVASDHRFENRMAATERSPELTFTMGDPPWPAPATDEEADYASPERLPSGRAVAAIHRLGHRSLYRWGEVVDFHVEPGSIVAHVLDPAYRFMVELRLLGPLFAYLLEAGGRLAMHASAVVVDGRAVGFLSENHGGKTSVAATFLQRGAELLTDDLLGLELEDGTVKGLPGYPQMRMWPREAQHFCGSVDDLEVVHPGLDKRRVPVGHGGVGTFHSAPAPLEAIYVLERLGGAGEVGPGDSGAGDFRVEMHTVSGAKAIMQLSEHCFVGRSAAALGWLPQRMRLLARLLGSVPVRRVRFVSGPADMAKLCDLVEKDLGGR